MNSSGRRIRVGVIDSGWRQRVTDARASTGAAFCARGTPYEVMINNDTDDLVGHGTICARTILAIAPSIELVPIRVFDRSLQTSAAVLCAALEWVAANPVDVLNMSLSTTLKTARSRLSALCDALAGCGTIIVAAARNGFGDGYPAVFENVLGVKTISAARKVRSPSIR